jgi:hypothetical protein
MQSTRAGLEHLLRAIPLIAAFSLVLHALLAGSGIASMPQVRTALPALHAQVDCHQHDGASEPADHHRSEHHPGFCCILCGKLGTIVGPPPILLAILKPQPIVSVITFGREQAGSVADTSLLPVGARAPPRLG